MNQEPKRQNQVENNLVDTIRTKKDSTYEDGNAMCLDRSVEIGRLDAFPPFPLLAKRGHSTSPNRETSKERASSIAPTAFPWLLDLDMCDSASCQNHFIQDAFCKQASLILVAALTFLRNKVP
jgi:hypothetical protein